MRPSVAAFSLVIIFAVASLILVLLARLLPGKLQDGKQGPKLSFPSNIDEVKDIAETLKTYQQDHFSLTLIIFSTAYLYKQTFAIPGSVFLNLLSGALFGLWIGFPLVCLLTASGASCCFLLSKCFGKEIIIYYFSDKLKLLQDKVASNKSGMFFFLLFLRLFPMSPNWFLNMASPILEVPITQFFPSVFLGLMPYNFICCQMGCILSELTSMDDILTRQFMLKMLGVAFVAVLPGLLLRLYKTRKSTKKHN